MGSIQIAPYHPLEQQPGPLQQMAQVLGVQNQQQQIQAGAQENQMRAQQINDQKAMTAAMHEWDGKDFDTLVPLASKNGASAQAVMGLKAKQLEIKDKYSQIAKNDSETGAKNLESMKQKNDMVLGGINGLSDVGDDQIGQKTAATAQNLIQQGLIDPQHGQALLQIAQQDPKSIRAALPMFSKDYMSQSAQMTKAKDDADLAAKAAQLPGQQADAQMKVRQDAATQLASATDKNSYAQILGKMPYQLATQFPSPTQWTPQTKNQILQMGMSPDQQVQTAQGAQRIAGEAAGRAETHRHNLTTEGQLTPEALTQAAQQFAATGQMPQMGRDAATRKAIMNEAAKMNPTLDIAANAAEYKANQASLKGLQTNFDSVSAFEKTANKNLDLFLNQAKNIVDTGSPLLNKPLRSIATGTLGSTDVAAVNAARQIANNEIAKVTSSPGLTGVLSDSARHEVMSYNPNDATLGQTIKVAGILRQDMANRHQSYEEQIQAIKSRLSGKPAQTQQSPTNTSNDPFAAFGGVKH